MKGWNSCIGCKGKGHLALTTEQTYVCNFSPEKHQHNLQVAKDRKQNPDEFEKNIITHFIYRRQRKPKDHAYEPRHEFGLSID